MRLISDLHLHSRFSRAVSQDMNIPTMWMWAKKKGIDLLATGDWTHPIWFRELVGNLKEAEEGFYTYKEGEGSGPYFLLSVEVSCIYSQGGKVRRIHLVVFVPSLGVAEKINRELVHQGVKLMSDGRPIMGLSAKEFLELVLSVDERSIIIPAHAWTPWFSLYGSMSGFDSLEECFGNLSSSIFAIETGLSSDPAMNWRIEELGSRQIVSFSDAHSPAKLGREVTVFELAKPNYENLRKAIAGTGKDSKILHTIEFYPEEGKYHFTGHRNCSVVYSPKETRKMGIVCPVCGKGLTVGVMSRVESLATVVVETSSELDSFQVRWVENKNKSKPPYAMLVPLLEILSESLGLGPSSKKVAETYDFLSNRFGGEFKVLLKTDLKDIQNASGLKISEAIQKVRVGDIVIDPGYDGVFGKVRIWKEKGVDEKQSIDQGALF